MFCPNCGKEAADGAKFCGNCGAKLPEKKIENPEKVKREVSSPAKPQKKISGKMVAVIAAVVVFGVLVKTVSGHMGEKKADIPDQEELATTEKTDVEAEKQTEADAEQTEDAAEPALTNVKDGRFVNLSTVKNRHNKKYWEVWGGENGTNVDHTMQVDKDGNIIHDFSIIPDYPKEIEDYYFFKDEVVAYQNHDNFQADFIRLFTLDGDDITDEYAPDGENIIFAQETDVGYRIVTYREEDTSSGHLDYVTVYDDNKNEIYSCERTQIEQQYMDLTGRDGTMNWDKWLHNWSGFVEYYAKGLFIMKVDWDKVAIFPEKQEAYKLDGDILSDGDYLMKEMYLYNKETWKYELLNIGRMVSMQKFVADGLVFSSNFARIENDTVEEVSALLTPYGDVAMYLDYGHRPLYTMSSFYDGYAYIVMRDEEENPLGMIIDENGNTVLDKAIPTDRDFYVYCPENKCFVVEQEEADGRVLIPLYTDGTIGKGVKVTDDEGINEEYSFIEDGGVYHCSYENRTFSSVKIE